MRLDRFWFRILCVLTVGVIAAASSAPALAQSNMDPETVLVTYHVKADQEQSLLKVLNQQWSALQRLDLVQKGQPHLLLRGTEEGKPVVFEVFTWITADTPDHAPAEIQALWKQMQNSVESRGGHPGIDIRTVTEVE
ncbi:MAG TPA: hypothetical protein VFQ00_08525 [Terriglobales bacterium]|nr:hypothetical protein [Terriglobales bacterium]